MRRALILLSCLLVPGLLRAAPEPARAVLLDPDNPEWSVRAPNLFRVQFWTSAGGLLLEAHRDWAPNGVDRLYNLVRLGFYDDTRVYRVREGFIAQFGLSGDPAVNAAWYDRTIPDDPVRRSNTRGTVSFAMLEAPNSRTTQLYVNLDDNAQLDEQGFAPIGRIVAGMEAADSFYAGYDEGAGGGMRGGQQGRIVAEGNAHLDADFPQLDRILSASILPGSTMRFPNIGGNRIRVEVHMLPAVSTGPLDPVWSPDGRWIAFSMRGDIWKVPSSGGEAVALTRGPAYHFEPAWSRDGESIAMSTDLDGNLDIGVTAAEGGGGQVRLLTSDPEVDVQPTWTHDGRVVFVSSREGSSSGFDLYSVGLDGSAPEPLVAGAGHQIWPAVSPDGRTLAFVSPVRGRLGVGALMTLDLATLAGNADDALAGAAVVHVEETSYRVRPTWSPDGRALVFVSDESGSNDVAVIPVTGGSKARLTQDDAGELGPVLSPDGMRLAFVSNREGATRLYTAPAGGARRWGWTPVPITARRPLDPTGRVRVHLTEAGGESAARLTVTGGDGRAYAPEGAFHRVASPTDMHYFHASGEVEVEVPAGPYAVDASHGMEYAPRRFEGVVREGETAEVSIDLVADLLASERGWYSGDTHAHDLHQGRFGLDHQAFFTQLQAEDMGVTNALIHMDGTRLMGRWDDLTGEPHPLSTPRHILQYGQEFRGSYGHVGLLGINEFVMPLIGGTGGTAFAADVLNADYVDAARAQGGIGGFMHPYSRSVDSPANGDSSEIVLDVALGKGDFYDVVCIPYDDKNNAEMYARFLNAGFRLPATGGSDNFADAWRDSPPGSARTYARLDGPLTVPAWLEAVKAGRTFATNGPLLFLDVDGHGPGEEIQLAADDAGAVEVKLEVGSAVPLEWVQLLVNGQVARGWDVRGAERGPDGYLRLQLQDSLEVDGSAWIAGRAIGPPARGLPAEYAFAHTTPVWVVRDGVPYTNAADARFLADMTSFLWDRVQRRDQFASDADRERYRVAAEEAIRVYEEIAARAPTPVRVPVPSFPVAETARSTGARR